MGIRWVLGGIGLILLGLGWTSAPWYRLWPFEVIGGLYWVWAGVCLILTLVLLALRDRFTWRWLIVIYLLALSFYGGTIGNAYIPRLRDLRSGGIPLTVITYNVNYRLWDTEQVTETVRSFPADLFGLVEPFREQAAALRERVHDLYPHYYRATGGGLSLFSRYPIVEATTEDLGTPHHSLFAIVEVKDQPIRVILTHPLAPVSRKNFTDRNQLLEALALYCADQRLTTLLMGDFNVTPWSIYFQDLVRDSRLRNASLGHGLNPTWFYNDSGRPLSGSEHLKQLLKIPIDHILVSQTVSVDQIRTVSAGISDHRPLVANLRVL